MGDLGGGGGGGVNAAGVEEHLDGTGRLRISPSATARRQRGDANGVEDVAEGRFEPCNVMSLWWSKSRAVGPPSSLNFPASGCQASRFIWRCGERNESLARAAMLHALGLEMTAPMTASEIVADPGYRGALPFIIAIPGPREPAGTGTRPLFAKLPQRSASP